MKFHSYENEMKSIFSILRIRGRLGSLMMVTLTTGILFAFVTGTYLKYSVIPKIFIALPVVFFAAFIFLPETPQHFLYRNNPEVRSTPYRSTSIETELTHFCVSSKNRARKNRCVSIEIVVAVILINVL